LFFIRYKLLLNINHRNIYFVLKNISPLSIYIQLEKALVFYTRA